MFFLTYFWRCLRSSKLEKLEFKLEKKYWDLEKCRKREKILIWHFLQKKHFLQLLSFQQLTFQNPIWSLFNQAL